MKKTLAISASVLALTMGYSLSSLANNNPPTCSKNTLKGTYTYHYTNFDIDGDSVSAESGIETYDGNGHILNNSSDSGSSTVNAMTGTYTLNADCVGTAIYTDGSHYNIFVDPDGSDFAFVQTNGTNAVAGEEKQVSTKIVTLTSP